MSEAEKPKRSPDYSPVFHAASRKAKEHAPALDVVKLSNITYGRLKTLKTKFPEMSYERGDIDYAFGILDAAREAVKKAEKARDEAVKAEKKAMAELDVELRKLNIDSQEMSNLQDCVTAVLAVVPLVVGVVVGGTPALVVGAGATVLDFANSALRANSEEQIVGDAFDLFGGGVDAVAEVDKLKAEAAAEAAGTTLAKYGYKAPRFLKGLKVASFISAGAEILDSKGIDAELTEISREGFNRLDDQISKAGALVDKGPAQKAADKARFAMEDRIRAEMVLQMKLAQYLKVLAYAEGVSWIRPH